MGLIIQIAKGYPPKNTNTRRATIDTFNIKSNYIYLPMLFMMIISILDNFFKFNAMPAKITIKSYYGSAVLLDKICLIYSSHSTVYHFTCVKAVSNDFTAQN